MFRGATARTLLTLLGVTLLALQLFTPTGNFTPAHTPGQALAKTQTGIAPSVQAVRDGAETVRAPGRPDAPVGLPHVRDRHRGPVSPGTGAHPPISGRTAEARPAASAGAPHHPAPGSSRSRTPAALQVFRC
ncbi:hypothetical protein JK361_03535 [Streptomyces sp. 5-8]|uniref:Secreted protein n=1 Tax=Streptomyces musisoli TaxID=2802280 RepID=A0ABS1NUA8_9ACTN|nr:MULTISPECIES: hypothetical protein [Streptomyces]MBL1103683.1 hypothetical protein [Streptomyces musisoli]MBY8839710.1 hypothetical protein [Streptomyces sp. SP2-10]